MTKIPLLLLLVSIAIGVHYAPTEKKLQMRAHLIKLLPVLERAQEPFELINEQAQLQLNWARMKLHSFWPDREIELPPDLIPEKVVEQQQLAACRLSGKVAGCGCDFASVERMNRDHLFPIMRSLVKQPYFRFFKVNLYCDCQFWPDAGLCFQRDCCVHECDASEIPEAWKEEDKEAARRKAQLCSMDSGVDRSVDEGVKGALSSISGWHGMNNPWVAEDEKSDVDYIYVDLQKNPEKYTGYKGEDARRIWAAIYEQPVLKEAADALAAAVAKQESKAPDGPLGAPLIHAGEEDEEGEDVDAEKKGGNGRGHVSAGGLVGVAREQEVLFRLISGMHSSITTSIVQNYYDESKDTWGPNMPFFKARFAVPAAKPYVENLYFTFLFVVRAAMKAQDILAATDLSTGSPEEDARTSHMMQTLLSSGVLSAHCPTPFDETLLWRHKNPAERDNLRQQLQVAFHNITRLMDCVGCEKCKMHGKLNILGIAAAMKILFAEASGEAKDRCEACGQKVTLNLERNEIIALINLLAKLSESVEVVRSLNVELELHPIQQPALVQSATTSSPAQSPPPLQAQTSEPKSEAKSATTS